jgi:FO synthase
VVGHHGRSAQAQRRIDSVITAPGLRAVGIDLTTLPDPSQAHALDGVPLEELLARAQALRDAGTGRLITFSPKVFIPLTQLCRDVCHYCTFAGPPKPGERAFLTPDEVLAIARAGAEAGCHEALFTLGDKPELRYKVAREELAALGHETTISYLVEVARLVLEETGLLPHANPGVLTHDDLRALRAVSPSQGIMLESVSLRLMEKGKAHHGSPDKHPDAPCDARSCRRGSGAVYEWHPHRHRRDAGRAH